MVHSMYGAGQSPVRKGRTMNTAERDHQSAPVDIPIQIVDLTPKMLKSQTRKIAPMP